MSSFDQALIQCPEKGMEQADIGLKHMRELSAVMLRVSSMEDDHTQRVSKVISDALAKMHSSGETRDGMATVHCAIMGTLTTMLQLNKHRGDLTRRMAEQVSEPLDRFHKNGVTRLKVLARREKEERTQLENQKNAVLKQKSQCLRLYEQTQTGTPDVTGQDKPSRLFKLAGTLGARSLTVGEAVEKLDTATALYDEMLESASILQERYFNICLPEILSALECLELDRGTIFVNQLKIASTEIQILSENTQKEAVQLKSLCDKIDIARDLTNFVSEISASTNQAQHTRKKSIFNYDLPVSPPNSIFRKPLVELIKANNGAAPELLKCLIQRMRELNAFSNTEGIFRISPDKSQLIAAKRQIESSDSIPTCLKSIDSVHVLAAILKEWLRELKQPLVPIETYDEVLKIGSQSGPDQQASLLAFWRVAVPRPSKVVILELRGIIDEVVRNAEKTKMNMYNVCVCLSPSLVRTPDSVPASIVMSNSKLEVAFTHALLKSDALTL